MPALLYLHLSEMRPLNPGAKYTGWSYHHFEAAFLKFIGNLDWSLVTGQTKTSFMQEKQAERTVLQGKLDDLHQIQTS